MIEKAFPAVPYSENKHVNVIGNKSPFDGDMVYWSERNSKLYDGETSKALKRQNHTCGHCGLKFADDETVHLHHINGNHSDWKVKNIVAIHQSCHQYIHMEENKNQRVDNKTVTSKPEKPVASCQKAKRTRTHEQKV